MAGEFEREYNRGAKNVQTVLELIQSKGINASTLAESFRLPDNTDEPFLEAALAAQADVLVTGNKKHFPKKSCKGQKVVTPGEFFRELG